MFYPFKNQEAQYCRLIRDHHKAIEFMDNKIRIVDQKYAGELNNFLNTTSAELINGRWVFEFSNIEKTPLDSNVIAYGSQIKCVDSIVGVETDYSFDVNSFDVILAYAKFTVEKEALSFSNHPIFAVAVVLTDK